MHPTHGGNVYAVARELGCRPEDILDFSASINPLGPPDGLERVLQENFARLQHYPDIHNRQLIEALARFHDLPEDQVAVGNGSTELIAWLPSTLGIRSAAVVLPTFAEYAKAFASQGVPLRKLHTRAENGFQPLVSELEGALCGQPPDAVLITHPGSPAGTLLSRDVRKWLLEKSKNDGFYLIVDEVFVDFCEGESLKRAAADHPRLVLIRSMTKFYGIPGLRVGYALAAPETTARLRSRVPPWSVNTLAQAAACYCLQQDAYRRRTLELVNRERTRLRAALNAIPGLRAFEGQANYLLVRMDERLPEASALQAALLHRHRLLIRDCASFEGLGTRDFRVAVRLPEENNRLLRAAKEWVTNVGPRYQWDR